MSDYTGPNMTAEFLKKNTPGAKLPASLKLVLVGRPINVEKDLYLGDYTYDSGLASTAIPDIPDGATLLGDDFMDVAIQLDANGEIVTVPEDSWSRTTTNIEIDASLVKLLSDKSAAASHDGTLTVATRLFSSVAVDFDEIGVVQNFSLLTLVDADDLEYAAYNAVLASGTDAGKLYIPGTSHLPTLKLTVDNTTNFSIGDSVDQVGSLATGDIVNIDGATTIVLGNVTGTFTVEGANAITNSGTGSCVATVGADLSAISWGFKVSLKMDGTARISHKSLRTDLCGVKTRVTTDTLLDIFGNDYSLTPDGDLGFGAKIGTDVAEECYVIGVDDINGARDDSNATASAWNAQFAYLKLQAQSDCAYQYVVMSENSEVHSYMDLFVSWMRTPAKSKICIGWSSFKAEFMSYIIEATALPSTHGAGTVNFAVSGETFQTKGVLDGGYVIFKDPSDSDNDHDPIRIVTVTSESAMALESNVPSEMDDTWTYTVVNSIYSLDEIANAAKLYGEGFESRAIRLCWNEQMDVIMDSVIYYDVPRYFWYVYRAADLSLATDISKTYCRDGVGYVFKTAKIPFRVGDTDRIDLVTSGGVDVVMQDKTGALVYSYDAVTTDMTDDLSRYQSITHQYDFAALAIFETYRDYLGKYKIENKTKALFVNMFTALARKLAAVKCLEYLKLISLDTNPDDSTRILLDADGRAIRPFRGLDARIWMN